MLLLYRVSEPRVNGTLGQLVLGRLQRNHGALRVTGMC
jgi:hypothetical protein